MNSNQRRKAKRAFEKQWPYKYELSWNYGASEVICWISPKCPPLSAQIREKIYDMQSWMIQNKIKHLWDDSEKTFWFATEQDLIWVKLKW